MKRCLAVCLFVCVSVCLASSAFAELLKWETDPVGTDATVWKSVTFSNVGGTVSYTDNLADFGGKVDVNDKVDNGPIVTIDFSGTKELIDLVKLTIKSTSGGISAIKINDDDTFPDNFWAIPPNQVIDGTFYLASGDIAISSISFYLNGWAALPLTVAFGSSLGNFDPTPTPEPASMLIFGLGLAGLGIARLRRKTV